jgi:transposase
MLTLSANLRIFVCATPVDLRKSFDGLAALVRDALADDPLSGHWYVFRNRVGDRLKILVWEGDGWALWYKKQEADCPRCSAFTNSSERAHNFSRGSASVGSMDAYSLSTDSRR